MVRARSSGRRPLAVLSGIVGIGLLALPPGAAPAAQPSAETRYSLANGCFALRSLAEDRLVAKADGGYAASAAQPGGAEGFRMQATDLGSYLLYGRAKDFLAVRGQSIEPAAEPGRAADWRVDRAGPGAFTLTSIETNRPLAVDPGTGELILGEGGAGDAARFGFEPARSCADFPEVEVNAVGMPSKGATAYGEVSGLLEAHTHQMAYEFLGGSVRCGRPWHRYGVTEALVDCPDHEPNGAGAVLENTLSYGNPVGTHDTTGWPEFTDWPHYASLTHEQVYYKWLERSWRGGLRVFVNLMVDNAVLCELYPIKRNSCNEMETVRLQIKRAYELQDYIDAQSGGPGKGWYRIVTNPFEAREVINDGKLAVILGMETSKLFDCGIYNDVPECDRAQIDRQLNEFYDLGVRDLELVNKFDNALAGVAGDAGETGVVVNSGNKYETGQYWQMETCTGPEHAHDRTQMTTPVSDQDNIFGNGLGAFLPKGQAPLYPDPPHCNTMGLTPLGEYLVRRMIRKGMIVDPDHMSVLARNQTLSLLESKDYSGVVSSHSWSTPDSFPRIYRLGGVVAPYAGDSTGFVHAWRDTRPMRSKRFYFGFGYGADMNGFGSQGPPREGGAPPVTYPFRSFDGAVSLGKQESGERVYDINVDGVAHYGLYPDWIEDLRMLAGESIIRDMARGSEAYLQMWERAVGVPAERCQRNRVRLTAHGIGNLRLGQEPREALLSAGQPRERVGRAWTYCVRGRQNRDAELVPVFTPGGEVGMIAGTARGEAKLGIGVGDDASRLRRTEELARGLEVDRRRGSALIYGVRGDRIRFVAVSDRSVASGKSRLLDYLRLAGVRG
jgi:microsomal dipeptidase-like Zn-dependent dipeptidase